MEQLRALAVPSAVEVNLCVDSLPALCAAIERSAGPPPAGKEPPPFDGVGYTRSRYLRAESERQLAAQFELDPVPPSAATPPLPAAPGAPVAPPEPSSAPEITPRPARTINPIKGEIDIP